MTKNVVIIIPAFNEATTIRQVLKRVKDCYPADHIVVIDDGSIDDTVSIAESEGVQVYSHAINRGLGGALGTGLEVAKLLKADVAVTLDADGQHDPDEVQRLIEPILAGTADVVIGSRLLQSSGMPFLRKCYNIVGNILTWIIFGVWTTDSQSGFRAFNADAIHSIQIKTNRMEVSSEFFKEIRGNRLRLEEIPIKAIYTPYSMSKGQNFFVGIKTVARLILLRLRGK